MYSSTPLHITTTPKRRPTATPSRNLTATFSTLSIATPGSTLRGIGRAPSFDPSNKLGTRPGDKGNGNLGGNLDYEDNNDSQEQQDINNLFTKLEDYDAPKITFHRDDRKLTADFIKHFDTLVDDLKKLIVERKEEYQRKIAQEKERERNIATEIDNLKKQHKHLTETFEEEIEKEKRYQDYIDEVSAKQVKSSQEVHELSEQVRQLKAELARRKEALAAKQDVVDGHRKMDRPELEFFEGALGLEIKGGSGGYGVYDIENELVFAFTKVAKLNPQKAHIVTVDLSERAYKVSRCDPEIPEMDALVSQLNQTRDFYGFLKHVRKAFSNISGG
ncbi:kinetochore-associated Ndc80 complex subunit spc25 [Mycoemilia scoparia]|uniref:Kinetochore protein SPC25 n=1 Tax=Mycoemilia scoparia TaxID=417184 RepID=A0A9W7ZXM7_9FUNG|nr:kinetochore-associated Ndc80 complex subunit spc25 [Mycoemilia scoparia]